MRKGGFGRCRASGVAISAAAALASTFWGSPASAQDAGDKRDKKVVALGDGPQGEAVVSGLSTRLGAGAYSQGDSDAFRAALGAAGRSMGAAARRKDKDAELVSKARAAARKSHADRVVLVHTEKGKKQPLVHAWVIDAQGSGAEVDQDVHVSPGSSADDQADAVWGAIESTFPAPDPPPSPAPAAKEAPAPASAPVEAIASVSPSPPDADTAGTSSAPAKGSDHTRSGSIASIGLQMQGGSRHFSYVDRLTNTLRPYDLFVAPVARVNADVYPMMTTRVPVLSWLGVQGSYAHAFALSSQDEQGNKVGTSWQSFDVGLRERIPLGSSFILGVDFDYGDNSFSFDNAISPAEQLPSVHYKYLRGGLDGRYVHRDLSFRAGAGYRDVMSTGDFGGLFPHASVGGVDGNLGAAYMVAKGLEIALDIDYARFFYSLNPVPGDKYVAGGALDEMASLSIGAAYLF